MAKTFLVLFMILITYGCGGNSKPVSNQANDEKDFVATAVANTQHVGEFYFIPFPSNHYGTQNTESIPEKLIAFDPVIKSLDRFQSQHKLTVVSYTVERDFHDRGLIGITIKAIPTK